MMLVVTAVSVRAHTSRYFDWVAVSVTQGILPHMLVYIGCPMECGIKLQANLAGRLKRGSKQVEVDLH